MTSETKIITGITAVTVLIVVGAAVLLGKSESPTNQSKPVDSKLLLNANSHVSGDPKAKVTVVEFGDYQCPACGAFYPISKQILKEYGSKIKFVFRNFPLDQVHPNAEIGAEAAETAGSQGKFWQMHDLLYEKQPEWGESKNPLDFFMQYAKTLGLDAAKFKSDVTGNKYASVIARDENDGNNAGVNATPTVFVNGEKVDIPNYDSLKSAIETALKRE